MTTTPPTIRLSYTPRPWQRRCRQSRRRFNVVVAHRRSGKSLFALVELVDAALQCKLPLPLFAYIAPQLKQAKAIAWLQLKDYIEPLRATGAVEIAEATLSIKFAHNGAVIRLLGAEEPNALRGLRLDGVVCDEVAQMDGSLWDAIVQPALADRRGWALFIGTPAGIDTFSDLYNKAEGRADWFRTIVPVDQTDALPADEIARLRAEMPPQAFAREFLCDFGASADDQLLSVAEVTEAATRTHAANVYSESPVVLGVDPARFGNDRSVIVRRQGLRLFEPLVLTGVDNMQLADTVAHEINQHTPEAVCIDSGAGAGVIDRLRQLGHKVIEVPFGGKARASTQYVNRRAELWFDFAAWLRRGGSIPADQALMRELAAPTFWFDPQGRRQLESKDDIKKRLSGASPDIADAAVLCCAIPDSALPGRYPQGRVYFQQSVLDARAAERRRKRDYDPLDLAAREMRVQGHPFRRGQ